MANWSLDLSHSTISFKVKHMMITNVNGSFSDFDVKLESNKDDFSDAKISFTTEVKSINTQNNQRDEHLRSADFFDVEKFPKMTFNSTSFFKKGDDFELIGELTIKETTKTVKLEVEFGGMFVDPWGKTKAGFSLNGKFKRSEFGLNWNAALESGGVLVSDEIKIQAEVQFTKD